MITNCEATNPNFTYFAFFFFFVFNVLYHLIDEKINENSGFLVSELVIGSGELDNHSILLLSHKNYFNATYVNACTY